MTRLNMLVGLLALGLLSASFQPGALDAAEASIAVPFEYDSGQHNVITWLTTGDSYSSGEGTFGNVGACAQSDQAYGPLSAQQLRADGWQVTSTLTACTGHTVDDFFVSQRNKDKKSQYRWGTEELGAPERVDALLLSYGGNDIGFSDIVKDCIDAKVLDWGALIREGCGISLSDFEKRVDGLLNPTEDCKGGRQHVRGDRQYMCKLLIGERADNGSVTTGSIVDFYERLATDHLTTRGRLFIVGYPSLVAPKSEWNYPKWGCGRFMAKDAELLLRAAEYLDDQLRDAVAEANLRIGGDKIMYVSTRDLFRSQQGELCGDGDKKLLNGFSVDRGNGFNLRQQGSYHPTAAGHEVTSNEIVGQMTGALYANYRACRYLEDAALAKLDDGMYGFQGPLVLQGTRTDVTLHRWEEGWANPTAYGFVDRMFTFESVFENTEHYETAGYAAILDNKLVDCSYGQERPEEAAARVSDSLTDAECETVLFQIGSGEDLVFCASSDGKISGRTGSTGDSRLPGCVLAENILRSGYNGFWHIVDRRSIEQPSYVYYETGASRVEVADVSGVGFSDPNLERCPDSFKAELDQASHDSGTIETSTVAQRAATTAQGCGVVSSAGGTDILVVIRDTGASCQEAVDIAHRFYHAPMNF